MKTTALAALLATTVALMPWQNAIAADAGDFLLGQRLYSLGDYTGALNAWQPLADQGDPRAQYSMAILYLKGRGVGQDKAKAMEWAGRAAEQGYKPARRLLEKLQPKKTSAKLQGPARQRKGAKPRKPASQMTELERIEAAVDDLLQQIAGKVAKDGTLHHGDLRAEKLAKGYQVTIPDIVIQADDGAVFDVGTVLAHVRHADKRFDDIALDLPGEMRFRKADGASGRITIAKRLAKLRWDRQLATSTEFEFRLSKLAILLDGQGEMGRIGAVLVQADVVEDQGLWTGPMDFSVTDLDLSDGVNSSLQLEQIKLTLDLRGLDLPAYSENLGLTAAKGTGKTSLQELLGVANGFALRAGVKNLVMRHPDQGEFRLDQADYGVDLSSDDGRRLNLALNTSHHGLVGTGSAAPDGMVPRDLDIALALEDLPSATVVNVGIAAVVEVSLLGKLSSAPQVFERLRNDLGAAATMLRLKRANVTAKDYTIAMSGSLRADQAAKAIFTGGGELRIRGLQKLLAAGRPNAKQGAKSPPRANPLAALAAKGQPIDGGSGHLFKLALRPDGQFTVNGEPVLSLVPMADQAQQ